MNLDPNQLGDFTIFGFSKNFSGSLKHRLAERLGLSPKTIDFGSAGQFFFYTSCGYGDLAESAEAIALKLGSLRSPTLSRLTAQELLNQKIAQPTSIDNSRVRGNGLIATFGKKQPSFSVYQTLMALPSVYYTRLGEDILCATDLRCLLALLDQQDIQLNEDAVPTHFLFGLTVGSSTYFRNISRLFPGQILSWKDGELSVRLARDLRFTGDGPTFEALNSASLDSLYEHMSEIMKTYMDEAKEAGQQVGNLLSGGIDSSLLQQLINDHLPQSETPASFSFAFEVANEREKEYAGHASQTFKTQHTFCDIPSQDYPDLLVRTIETLAQPNLRYEGELGKFAIAEFLAAQAPDINFFFAGQGADGLHGFNVAKRVALLERVKRIPGSRFGLQILAPLLKPWGGSKTAGLQDVAKMMRHSSASMQATPTIHLPTNLVELRTRELAVLRRSFGDKAILKAFDARRNLEAQYLDSTSEVEKMQMIGYLTTGYGHGASVSHQFFSSRRKRLVQFFLDEDVIRLTMAINSKIRFLQGATPKPFLKQMLDRKSFSTLAEKKKLGTTLRNHVVDWMKQGSLQDMIEAIDVPGFVSKPALFDEMLKYREIGLLWNLLTFDIFQKRILKSQTQWWKNSERD